jgi:HD-like signal output (HDOD) protein
MTESSTTAPIFELINDPRATQALPSLQAIVWQLQQLTGQSHTRIQEISDVIKNDQSLTVRLLRLANSAFYAPAEPILNIDEAVLFLGMAQVRNSILTARFIEQTCTVPDGLLKWRDFWLHEISTGVIMQLLSTHMEEQRLGEDSYYAVGLFHDIGKLVLAYLSMDFFTQVLRETKQRGTGTAPVEIDILGLNHASIGAWYLQQQGLPPSLYEAIRLHHSWQFASGPREEAAMISLADQISHLLKMGHSGSLWPADWDPGESQEWLYFQKLALPTLPAWPDLLVNCWQKVKHVPEYLDVLTSLSQQESPLKPISDNG